MGNCRSRKKRNQVDKATSNTNLNQKEAAPPGPGQHHQRERIREEADHGRSDTSLSDIDGTEIEQPTRFPTPFLSPHQRETPPKGQPYPSDHSQHRNPSPARDTSFDGEEPSGRETQRRIHSQAPRRVGESPDRQTPSGKEPLHWKKSKKKWRSKSTSRKSSAYRKRSASWQRSYDWKSSARKGSHERERSHRERSADGHKSSPARRNAPGQSCESCMGPGKAEAFKCLLVVLFVGFAVMFTYPPCMTPVSWAVLPQQAPLGILLNMTLLVIAVCSILATVKTSITATTELAVASVLCLLNAFLVHQLKCFFPHLSLWLSALVLPLALLAACMLCRDLALSSSHTR